MSAGPEMTAAGGWPGVTSGFRACLTLDLEAGQRLLRAWPHAGLGRIAASITPSLLGAGARPCLWPEATRGASVRAFTPADTAAAREAGKRVFKIPIWKTGCVLQGADGGGMDSEHKRERRRLGQPRVVGVHCPWQPCSSSSGPEGSVRRRL